MIYAIHLAHVLLSVFQLGGEPIDLSKLTVVVHRTSWANPYFHWMPNGTILGFEGHNTAQDSFVDKVKEFIPNGGVRDSKMSELFRTMGNSTAIVWSRMSPNTKWILCQTKGPGNTVPDGWALFRTDGSRIVRGPASRVLVSAAWLDDSRTFLVVESSPTRPHEFRVMKYRLTTGETYSEQMIHSDALSRIPYKRVELLGIGGGGRIFVGGFPNFPATTSFDLLEMKYKDRNGLLRKTKISLPTKGVLYELSLSPNRKHLALTVFVERAQAGKALGSRWIQAVLIRIVNPRIGSARTLCRIEVDSNLGQSAGGLPEALQWTPKGQRIAFLFRNRIYSVSAKVSD